MKKIACFLACLWICLPTSRSVAEDWIRFRGPNAQGVATAETAPLYWSDEENIAWKTALPGFGASCPITLGERIFITAYSGYGFDLDEPGDQNNLQHNVLSIDRNDGKVLWAKGVKARTPDSPYEEGYMSKHGYASSTPTTDGERVYAFFGRAGVVCYSLEGEPIWQSSVGDGIHRWGSATSPILYENWLIVNASVESQSIVALDKLSGKEVWRANDIIRSWSTPLVVTLADGRKELVVSMQGRVSGFDPNTGKELWRCRSVEDYVCPSVIAHEDVVFVSGGRSGALTLAVRAGGSGEVTKTHRLWTLPKTSKVPTPLYHEGYLYWIGHTGTAICIDASTGQVKYSEQLQISGQGDKVYASMVAVGDRLYAVTRQDGTIVLTMGPEFDELTRNHLRQDESIFNATAVPVDGQLLIRSDRYLYCIGKK